MRVFFALLIPALTAGQGLWETRAPLPVAATEVASAELNGTIYTTCGLEQNRRAVPLYAYDPRLDVWSEAAANPIEGTADHCNFAAASGRLYLLGAIRIGSPFVDGETREYDPRTRQWTTVARMNVPRGASGVAVIGGKIYVAGGLSRSGSVAAFEVFDTATRTWTRLPDMPTARDHLTAQAVNGKFYAIAGRAERDFNITEEFDPATNAWRTVAPIITARGGLASGVINGRIVAFGGEGNSGTPEGTFRQNEEYDPASNTWRSLAPMITPRHGFYGASFAGRIFAPAGGPIAGGFYSDVHEVFYLPAERPRIASLRNAASFENAFAPGMFVSLFGTNLSLGERVASAVPLPARLNAVEVKLNGTAVPLIYTGPEQINFVIPADLATGDVSISVSNAGMEGGSVTLTISQSAPGIFTLDQSGQGQGAVLIAGTPFIARATRDAFSQAARRGGVVEIYLTGLGRGIDPVVQIGGARAEVLFAGPHPHYPGLQQVNARVAATANTGIAVPVTITAGGRTSNTVTIAVVE